MHNKNNFLKKYISQVHVQKIIFWQLRRLELGQTLIEYMRKQRPREGYTFFFNNLKISDC